MQLRYDLARAAPTTGRPAFNDHRSMAMNSKPKSYLTDEDRVRRRAGGMSENAILLAESRAADHAGDEEAAWAWLALAELPAHSLAFLKNQQGAAFIQSHGFNTAQADAAFGPGWLDRA